MKSREIESGIIILKDLLLVIDSCESELIKAGYKGKWAMQVSLRLFNYLKEKQSLLTNLFYDTELENKYKVEYTIRLSLIEVNRAIELNNFDRLNQGIYTIKSDINCTLNRLIRQESF